MMDFHHFPIFSLKKLLLCLISTLIFFAACDCNLTGVMENSVCNETSGQCQCKFNVQGRTCDECKDTFFNLQADNSVGCQREYNIIR